MNKEILFSVTADNCEWQYLRGSGKGGQKKNKTSSAVRCTHHPSGASGYAEDTRSQSKNKSLAFKRMAGSKEFVKWHKIEINRRLGIIDQIEEKIEQEMKNICTEVRKNGIWTKEEK